MSDSKTYWTLNTHSIKSVGVSEVIILLLITEYEQSNMQAYIYGFIYPPSSFMTKYTWEKTFRILQKQIKMNSYTYA